MLDIPAATTLGARECMDRGIDFAETFRRQYLFSQEPVDVPDTWVSYRIAGGRLAVCPELDVTRIVTSGNKTLGYVLGIALTDESVLLSDTYVLDDEDLAAIEAWVESLSGRYVVILGTAAFRRLYVDPSCSLVTFYNPQNGRAGTSLPLVLDRPVEDNPALPRDVYRERAGTYYLLGDTADRAVRRMISNHFLDLRTFEIHRHWPKPDMDFSPAETPTVALDTIVQRLARHVHTLMRDRTCAFPISGGGDSRLLLTAAAYGGALDFDTKFFVHTDNFMTKLDCVVAVTLAQRLNLPLQIVSAASARVLEHFSEDRLDKLSAMVDLRSSYQDNYSPKKLVVHESPPRAELLLRGGLIEMTRLNKWMVGWGDFTPERGLHALPHPRPLDGALHEERLPAYRRWYEALPDNARQAAVDFGHFEIWLPAVANTTYQTMANHFMMNPFNDRLLLQKTAQLPYKFRKLGRPQRYIIRTCLPEIRDVPYASKDLLKRLNTPSDERNVFQSMGWV